MTRRHSGGGATWTVDCRWQVRLLDSEGEPLTTWRWVDTLRDCRVELIEHVDAIGAQVKHDGEPYGQLVFGEQGPILKRGAW